MKTIVKSTPAPACLARAQQAGWNWDQFGKLDHDGHVEVLQLALHDQKKECAYTGLWLGEGTKLKVHIDHFQKKGIYQDQEFAWENLFAAAKDRKDGADYKDNQISGPREKADATYSTFWSPLQANLEKAFWYRQDGTIQPDPGLSEEDRVKAQNTIEMFNLNSPDLKSKRYGIILKTRGVHDLSDDMVRECLATQGFSFLVNFELAHRKRDSE